MHLRRPERGEHMARRPVTRRREDGTVRPGWVDDRDEGDTPAVLDDVGHGRPDVVDRSLAQPGAMSEIT